MDKAQSTHLSQVPECPFRRSVSHFVSIGTQNGTLYWRPKSDDAVLSIGRIVPSAARKRDAGSSLIVAASDNHSAPVNNRNKQNSR
jgi:hypothetical protein